MFVDCPACQTRLQVRAEHLRSGRGRVCCSVCQHQFDALALLQDDEQPHEGAPSVDGLPHDAAEIPPLVFRSEERGIADDEMAIVESSEPLQDVADDAEAGEVGKKPRRMAVWWIIAGGAAGALLSTQVLMIFGPRWVADPAWRPLFEWACGRARSLGVSCILPPLVDMRLMALESHQITSHPQRPDGLLFDAELVNQAPFAQAYPRIRLSVEDPWGGSMAIGTFAPQTYLPAFVDRNALLPPHARIPVHLELVDPGGQAAGYRFELLPPE
mgnify:CR=1 FL=1